MPVNSIFRILFLSFLLPGFQLLVSSCGENTRTGQQVQLPAVNSDTILEYNRGIARGEDEEIDAVISRYRWDMQKTPTGLRYMIYQHGSGPSPKDNNTVTFSFEVRLINGKLCYTSADPKTGPKEARLGHGELPRGLEEGIKHMKVGDRAKLIVPSHLAFGLMGDQDRIPPGATLIYDVGLLKVK